MLKGVPGFLRGPLRAAFRVSLEARRLKRARDAVGRERAWKLLDLTSQMFLHRPPGERFVPKEELTQRFEQLAAGNCLELWEASRVPPRRGTPARRAGDEQRAARADALVSRGKLSSARQAVESAGLAPRTEATGAEAGRRARRFAGRSADFRPRGALQTLQKEAAPQPPQREAGHCCRAFRSDRGPPEVPTIEDNDAADIHTLC